MATTQTNNPASPPSGSTAAVGKPSGAGNDNDHRGKLGEDAKRASQDLQAKGKEVTEQARQKTQEIADDVRQRAGEALTEQKSAAADQLKGVSRALRKTAQELDDDQRWLADGVDRAARSLESFSESLRERDLGALMRQLEDYTRRQPAVVIGGAALAGFLLSRFLKSSADDDASHTGAATSPAQAQSLGTSTATTNTGTVNRPATTR